MKVNEALKAQEDAQKEMAKASEKIDQSQKDVQSAIDVEAIKEVISGLSAADQEKKDKQRPKIDKVLLKVEGKKTEAADLFKLGQYGGAVKVYKQGTEVLENAIEDFPLFKQEFVQIEATIFNNIAACCNKELNSKTEIEFVTKVIENQAYLTDKSVLLKAYLRRGLAYEQMEKYLQAREDMLSVREL